MTGREQGPDRRERGQDRFRSAVGRLLGIARGTPLRATLIALLTAPVLAVFGDVVAKKLPDWATYGLFVLVPTLIVLVVLTQLFDRSPPPLEPPPNLLPPWRPSEPDLLFGRTDALRRAHRLATAGGIVGIVGPRDAGTSVVASAVVRGLPASPAPDGGLSWYRLDLRGRSPQEPEQARVVATQLLGGFGLDPPADGSDGELRAAAHRLQMALRNRSVVLFLDNVFKPEQVRWLVDQTGPLTVVVAGEEAVAGAFTYDRLVWIGSLDDVSADRLFRSRLDEPPERSQTPRRGSRRLHWPKGWPKGLGHRRHGPVDRQDVLTVVQACLYLPGVIVDIADELRRDDSEWTLATLAAAMNALTDAEPPPKKNPAVWVWTKFLLPRMPSLSREARELMAALAGLDVTELPGSALAELLPGGAGDALDELLSRHLVRFVPPDRFRMPEEVRLAVQHEMPRSRVTQAAVAATGRLVAYYAERAVSEAERLRSPTTAAYATAWFIAEERLLVALLVGAAKLVGAAEVPQRGVERIAGAIDAWYVRNGDAVGLAELAQTTRLAAERLGEPDLVALARLRRATAHRMARELADTERELAAADDLLLPLRSSQRAGPSAWQNVEARRRNGWVLLRLAQLQASEPDVAARERLVEAEQQLQLYQRLLPQADKVGEVSVLVNLGAVRLALGDPNRAKTHLIHARDRATAAGDRSGWAHAVELLGIAAWQGAVTEAGAVDEAFGHWQDAEAAFNELGETVAAARCRGHREGRRSVTQF